MYCPKCSCHAGLDGSRFCRSCGFRLDGVVQLLARNGAPEGFVQSAPVVVSKPASPRKEGIRKGGKLLFGAIAFFPLFFGLCFPFDSPGPLLIPAFVFFAGMMRMLYAQLFEDAVPETPVAYPPFVPQVAITPPQPVSFLPGNHHPTQAAQTPHVSQAALPQANVPTTGNLVMPPSVTEQPTYPLNRS